MRITNQYGTFDTSVFGAFRYVGMLTYTSWVRRFLETETVNRDVTGKKSKKLSAEESQRFFNEWLS